MTDFCDVVVRNRRLGALISAALASVLLGLGIEAPSGLSAQSAACTPPNSNPVACENQKPGNPSSEWDVVGAGDPGIQGFATDISVNKGQTVRFKVATASSLYRIDIYRVGYYDGMGARKVATVIPSVPLPQSQPSCVTDSATGLVDCGNWAESASWAVPADATSGVYIGRLTRTDTGGASHIMFVVRDDIGNSDVLFQTSDTTWQAYNSYGGNSFYSGAPAGRAKKVSYNRPFVTRGNQYQRASFFGGEYPMVRWLEANGYHVSYATGVDTDRRGSALLDHRVFLSVGHDEYWSGAQRANVEAARAAGVSLAFFSGNEMFWKTRWEASIDGRGTPYRTLVSYKETHSDAKVDPLANVWTGTWRDARFSPPADGGRPENALTGTIFTVNCCTQDAIGVSTEQGRLRFWRNTSLAQLGPSQTVSVAPGIVGYESDEDLDNGFRPAGLIRLSSATRPVSSRLIDNGSTYGPGVATHSLTLYRHTSGALVFGAGLTRWAWALDVTHDPDSATPNVPAVPVVAIQQATVNLLGDMSAQPATLQLGLVAASPSVDTLAPTSVITSPVSGANVQAGVTVPIRGTATDAGGGSVAGIEVSVDGGATWHRAEGTSTWTYNWLPGSAGTSVLKARASDDSGNLEVPSGSTPVTIAPQSCPCSIWDPSATPAIPSDDEIAALELGVKFRTDSSGYISALRFYKGAANTGTHTGKLWTSTGTLMASLTFTGETSSGWQQASFSAPVAVNANTTYVASYHTNVGRYASSSGYFATTGVDRAPLHAPASGVSGGNGVYVYGASAFPSFTYDATNYWVDVVFVTGASDTTPPVITAAGASPTADSATITWTTNESATSRVDYGLTPTTLTSSQTSGGLGTSHSVLIAGLASNTTYYYRVTSADASGNATTAPLPAAAPSSFATPAAGAPLLSVTDTTVDDFVQGTVAAKVYLARTGDGEVTLQPQAGSEFDGAVVPAGWSITPWDGGGSTSFAAGSAVVDGARFNTDQQFTPGRAVEFVATFVQGPYQHIGFGNTLGAPPWAIFSTAGGQGFFARTNNGVSATDLALPTTLLGAPHRYRIEWTTSQVLYKVDGALVATHPLSITGSMRPIASEPASGGLTLSMEWLRMTPYAGSATFTSRVLDAQGVVSWSTADWTASVPPGTTLGVSARFGNTPIPDENWTPYAAVSAGGALTASSRYVQYRAAMTSSGADTPVLSDVTFGAPGSSGGSPAVSIGDVSVTEGDAGTVNAVFTVTLSAVGSQPVTVNYATVNGTAIAPADYTATSGTLSFPAGATTATITVAVAGDTLDEANDTFSVNLSGPVNATIADATGGGTIIDDDAVPTLTIANASTTEGNGGTKKLTFTLTLSKASGRSLSVAHATANGSAVAGSDYTALSGTVVFAAGTVSQTIAIDIRGDTTREPNETFVVNLSSPVNVTLGVTQATGTILNND